MDTERCEVLAFCQRVRARAAERDRRQQYHHWATMCRMMGCDPLPPPPSSSPDDDSIGQQQLVTPLYTVTVDAHGRPRILYAGGIECEPEDIEREHMITRIPVPAVHSECRTSADLRQHHMSNSMKAATIRHLLPYGCGPRSLFCVSREFDTPPDRDRSRGGHTQKRRRTAAAATAAQ